jgi:6-phosphogluconolactonase
VSVPEPETHVLDDPAEAAAELIAGVARAGGHIALSGGSTPRAAYERVAGMDVDWSGATLWFGDERSVPPDDERSNFGMVRAALLDRLSGPAPVVRRIEGERDHHEAAADYERALRQTFGEGVPRLDLILLGLGPDVHTASLFPGQPALDEHERPAVGVDEAGMDPRVPRVTLTLPTINGARAVAFLVAGEDKADAVARAFAGPPSHAAPASLVKPDAGRLTLLLDPAAAARLEAEAERVTP